MLKEEITGIILSGGKSSRLGREKGLALLNGKPLIQYAIDILKPISDRLFISANNHLEEYASLGYEVVEDEQKGIGPMGGLTTCLKKSNTRYNFILSCDTPFVPAEMFAYLLDSIENFQLAIPRHEDQFIEPLCAVYATNVIWQMEKSIENRNYKLYDFIKNTNTKFVDIQNHLPFYHEEMFVNMNTREDIQNKTENE
jgi:molybdopterin-guanine dinucleotide biosynthesis protein A